MMGFGWSYNILTFIVVILTGWGLYRLGIGTWSISGFIFNEEFAFCYYFHMRNGDWNKTQQTTVFIALKLDKITKLDSDKCQ